MSEKEFVRRMPKGTKVQIRNVTAEGSLDYEGTVISANNWGHPGEFDDWYIEFSDSQCPYRYYKQKFDGGSPTFLS